MEKSTKERIIESGLGLFRDKGMQNVTVEDICQVAGITRSAFYYHFKEKDELFDDFYLIPDKYIQDNLIHILSSGSYIEQLYAIYDIYFEPSIKYGPEVLGQAYHRSMAKPLKNLVPQHVASFPVYISLIENAQKNKQILNLSPAEKLAETAVYIGIGLAVSWCSQGGNFDIVAETHKAFDGLFMKVKS